MSLWTWRSWDFDIATVGWLLWMLFFFVWEWVTSRFSGNGEMLTDHLRPIFLSAPVIWFAAFGLWLWIGIHLLAPRLEAFLLRLLGGSGG